MRARDLHARFGRDEFCLMIPDLPGYEEAVHIAERFKRVVERYDWTREDPRLADRPVQVDVGVVCLRQGPVAERRGIARRLAEELIQLADKLMGCVPSSVEKARWRNASCWRLTTLLLISGGALTRADIDDRAS